VSRVLVNTGEHPGETPLKTLAICSSSRARRDQVVGMVPDLRFAHVERPASSEGTAMTCSGNETAWKE
jgi:hypothetical protein